MPPRRTEQRAARGETADFADFGQIKGVLPHAGRTKEAWKFRGLEAWLFAAYAALYSASTVAHLCALLYLLNLLNLLWSL